MWAPSKIFLAKQTQETTCPPENIDRTLTASEQRQVWSLRFQVQVSYKSKLAYKIWRFIEQIVILVFLTF